MTSLTFYGGAGEIGGNKILLEDKGVKIYLDFGESFDFGEDFFYKYLEPRKANGLEVYFEFGLVPKIPKLYSSKMLELTDLKYEKPDVDGVIISHLHSDHTGHLRFLDEDIPVYIGHGTNRIMEIYHKIYPQFSYIGEHKNIRLFKSGDKIKIKHLVIEPIHVEHSVPGAYGFIIHTSKGPIVYTGDFRIHGPRSDMTKEFIEKARKSKPFAMLCEGTWMRGEQEHSYSEKEVGERISEIVSKSKGTVFGYFSMTNADRFMSFYKSAVENNRILVIDARLAYIIDNIRDKVTVLPDVLKDKHIKVYYRISKSCKFCEKDYGVLERPYMQNMITYREIAKKPKSYVMHLNFNKLMELVYLQPKNADFIYSSSEHFLEGEDKAKEKRVLENWMKHFGINFYKAHCSGHASKEDLIKAIKKVNPKMLIPIHTSYQRGFEEYHPNVALIAKNKTLQL